MEKIFHWFFHCMALFYTFFRTQRFSVRTRARRHPGYIRRPPVLCWYLPVLFPFLPAAFSPVFLPRERNSGMLLKDDKFLHCHEGVPFFFVFYLRKSSWVFMASLSSARIYIAPFLSSLFYWHLSYFLFLQLFLHELLTLPEIYVQKAIFQLLSSKEVWIC